MCKYSFYYKSAFIADVLEVRTCMLLLQTNPDYFIDTGKRQGLQKLVIPRCPDNLQVPLYIENPSGTKLVWPSLSFALSL